MIHLLKLIFGVLVRSFRPRRDLLLENLALRQQLAVLARRRAQPRFSNDLLPSLQITEPLCFRRCNRGTCCSSRRSSIGQSGYPAQAERPAPVIENIRRVRMRSISRCIAL